MSSGKAVYSIPAETQTLEATRRREAEALNKRLGAAASAVAEQQARYGSLVSRLDQARSQLPDLDYIVPTLPEAPRETTPEAVEEFAAALKEWLGRIERDAETAIAAAKSIKLRREQLAMTWQEMRAVADEIQIREAVCRRLAQSIHASVEDYSSTLPDAGASLEVAQMALHRLRADLGRLQSLQASLEQQLQARLSAATLCGDGVAVMTAAERLEDWQRARQQGARDEAMQAISAVLKRCELVLEELPVALQLQVQTLLEQPDDAMDRMRLTDLIARHRVRLDGIAHVKMLMASPPDYRDLDISARWHNLVGRLQAVACGHQEFSHSLALEHAQVHMDANRAIQRAYAKAAFIEACTQAGFQVIDNDEVIMMDLDEFPDVWLEASQQPDSDGYATVIALKAVESADPQQDANTINAVCQKLKSLTLKSPSTVKTAVHDLEAGEKLPRAKRPQRVAAKSFAMPFPPPKKQ